MIFGYKLTENQSNLLRGQKFNSTSFFNPVKDKNGDYFIFEHEVNECDVEDFYWVKKLKKSEFVSAYYTPPTPTYMGIEIPDKFLWVFPDNKFVLEGFEIPLQYGAVDVAYFKWQAFRDCLDNGNHEFLKRALMPLWDYVAEQAEQQNFIQL
jgi:hypothetical protein